MESLRKKRKKKEREEREAWATRVGRECIGNDEETLGALHTRPLASQVNNILTCPLFFFFLLLLLFITFILKTKS